MMSRSPARRSLARAIATPIALSSALALAACGSSGDDQAAGGSGAQGDLKGGTVTDDMLPLDQLKSKSPPMKPSPAATSTSSGGGGTQAASEEEENAGDGPAATDEPAAPGEAAAEDSEG
ncbi:hypothetical protein WAB17_02610 [Parerythrobacter aurantius]|uniref:hypothetical protein n=1 Tax=Parerythrobacter aurantius TaxID=3127706 RepID=UPI003251836F